MSDANRQVSPYLDTEFTRWREEDLRHARAYERMTETWNALEAFADAPEMVAVRYEAQRVRRS